MKLNKGGEQWFEQLASVRYAIVKTWNRILLRVKGISQEESEESLLPARPYSMVATVRSAEQGLGLIKLVNVQLATEPVSLSTRYI